MSSSTIFWNPISEDILLDSLLINYEQKSFYEGLHKRGEEYLTSAAADPISSGILINELKDTSKSFSAGSLQIKLITT